MDIARLAADLRRDEGVRRSAYQDTEGYWTIGVGRLIDARLGGGLSDDEISYLLTNDIQRVTADLDRALPWWREMNEPRKEVLANMAFNLGIGGLQKFKRTLALLRRGDYGAAAQEMQRSLWARQVGQRAVRLADQIAIGERQEKGAT